MVQWLITFPKAAATMISIPPALSLRDFATVSSRGRFQWNLGGSVTALTNRMLHK